MLSPSNSVPELTRRTGRCDASWFQPASSSKTEVHTGVVCRPHQEGLVLEGQVKKMIIKPSVNKYIAKRVLRGKTIAKQGCRLVEAERRKFSSKFPRYNTVVECPKNNGWLDTGPETCWKHSNSVCTWYVHSDEAGVQHECKSVREKDL